MGIFSTALRWWQGILVGLLVLAGVLLGYQTFRNHQAAPRTIPVTGTIEATQVEVTAKYTGRIVALPVREGAAVRQGDLLVTLDDAELRAEVSRLDAALGAARAQLRDLLAGARKEEVEEAKANGIDPVEHIIARDAIAVIVNPENPVNKLTLQQISDIYSGKLTNWSEVGGEDRPIVRLSRETNSGTHVYFLETVLRLGSKEDKTLFSTDTLLLPSSEGIIAEVRQNPNAIGYDGLGYVPKDLKMIAIAKEAGRAYVLPAIETVNDKTYAIARDLYMYTDGEATGVVKEYLDWILSPEAQQIVAELGFVPALNPSPSP